MTGPQNCTCEVKFLCQWNFIHFFFIWENHFLLKTFFTETKSFNHFLSYVSLCKVSVHRSQKSKKNAGSKAAKFKHSKRENLRLGSLVHLFEDGTKSKIPSEITPRIFTDGSLLNPPKKLYIVSDSPHANRALQTEQNFRSICGIPRWSRFGYAVS